MSFSKNQSDALYDELDIEKTPSSSLSTIISIPNSVPRVSIVPQLTTIHEVPDNHEVNEPLLRKTELTRASFMADVSCRLARRKLLHNRLYKKSFLTLIL